MHLCPGLNSSVYVDCCMVQFVKTWEDSKVPWDTWGKVINFLYVQFRSKYNQLQHAHIIMYFATWLKLWNWRATPPHVTRNVAQNTDTHFALAHAQRSGPEANYLHPHILTSHPQPLHIHNPPRAQSTAMNVVTTMLRRCWERNHWWGCVWRHVPLAPTWTPPHVSVSPAMMGVRCKQDVQDLFLMLTEPTVVWSVTVCSWTGRGNRSVLVIIYLLLSTQ